MTVVAMKELLLDNEKFRIDDGYFHKEALLVQRRIEALPHLPLGDACSVFRKGIFDIKADSYKEEGIPFVRIGDLRNGLIEPTNLVYIMPEVHQVEAKTALKFGDIILSKTAYPSAALVTVSECNISQDTVAVRLSHLWQEKLKSGFVVAYLNGKYGTALMQRQFQGNVQLHLALQDGKKVAVPLFSTNLQDRVHRVFIDGNNKLTEGKKHDLDAQETLMGSLALTNWSPPDPLTYTRRASEVFAARRVDPPYFSPRVSQLLQLLSSDNTRIGDVAPARHEEFIAGSIGEFDYIEISDIQADGTAASNRLSQADAPSRATWYVRPDDMLASTVRPIHRLSAIVAPEQDSFVCSSGFVVLAPQAVSSELLLTYLRLPQVCELMDLHTSASMYPAISEGDLLNLPFRRVSSDVERKIVSAVQQSHSARREAHILLDRAKRAVEIAIELSEAEALRYLSESSG